MTARLDSWIRDFADKMPFSSNLAESPMPAVVETRVMKCLQKKKKSFRICIPKYAPGKWRGFPFWGGSEEWKQYTDDEQKPKTC